MLLPFDEAKDTEWYESQEAKDWATTAYLVPPPEIQSEEREAIKMSIQDDVSLITDLCLDSFWKGDQASAPPRNGEQDVPGEALTLKERVNSLKVSVCQRKASLALWRLLAPELLGSIFYHLEDKVKIVKDPALILVTRSRGSRSLANDLRQVSASTQAATAGRDRILHKSFAPGHRVAQVCRHWRQVAVSTPQLWVPSSIEGVLLHPALLDLWLRRTGSIPLHLQLTPPLDTRTQGILTKHVRRWGSLIFNATHEWNMATQSEVSTFITKAKRSTRLDHSTFVGNSIPSPPPPPPPMLFGHNLQHPPPMGLHDETPQPAEEEVRPIAVYDSTNARFQQIPAFYKPMAAMRNGGGSFWRLNIGYRGPNAFISVSASFLRVPLYDEDGNSSGKMTEEVLSLDFSHLTSFGSIPPGSKVVESSSVSEVHTATLPIHSGWSDLLLEDLAVNAPKIQTLIFPGFIAGTVLPPMQSLTTIVIAKSYGGQRFDLEQWLDSAPNVMYLTMTDTLWVESRATSTLLPYLAGKDDDDDFHWSKMDGAHLYGWYDRWFMCLSKKGPLSSIVEHPFSDAMPMTDFPIRRMGTHPGDERRQSQGKNARDPAGMERWRFPYLVDLSWNELQRVVEAVALEARTGSSYSE